MTKREQNTLEQAIADVEWLQQALDNDERGDLFPVGPVAGLLPKLDTLIGWAHAHDRPGLAKILSANKTDVHQLAARLLDVFSGGRPLSFTPENEEYHVPTADGYTVFLFEQKVTELHGHLAAIKDDLEEANAPRAHGGNDQNDARRKLLTADDIGPYIKEEPDSLRRDLLMMVVIGSAKDVCEGHTKYRMQLAKVLGLNFRKFKALESRHERCVDNPDKRNGVAFKEFRNTAAAIKIAELTKKLDIL